MGVVCFSDKTPSLPQGHTLRLSGWVLKRKGACAVFWAWEHWYDVIGCPQRAAIGPQKKPSRGWDPMLTRALLLTSTEESGNSELKGTKKGHGAMAGREDGFPSNRALGRTCRALTTCVPHPSKLHSSPLPVVWPWKLIQPVWIKEVQCASCSPPPWGIYSLAPSLGHLGQAVRSAESSGRSFLEILTSRFWWLPLTLVALGQELATAHCHPWVSLPHAHIFANAVSPLHMKESYSERGFVSQVCSLSPANLA